MIARVYPTPYVGDHHLGAPSMHRSVHDDATFDQDPDLWRGIHRRPENSGSLPRLRTLLCHGGRCNILNLKLEYGGILCTNETCFNKKRMAYLVNGLDECFEYPWMLKFELTMEDAADMKHTLWLLQIDRFLRQSSPPIRFWKKTCIAVQILVLGVDGRLFPWVL